MHSNKENELSKLRRAIEDQRMKAERVDSTAKNLGGGNTYVYSGSSGGSGHNSSGSPEAENAYPVFVSPDHWSSAASTVSGHSLAISAGSTLTRSNVDNLSPNSPINKRVSSGSLSSVSSHISGSSSSTGSSGPEIEAAMKQSKKKRWLPLKSAFSKGSKSHSSSQNDLLDSEDSGCPLSPTLSRRAMNHTGSIGSSSESEAIQELLQIVQEKERKLTDVRLEALTSQHQLHQLREQISQMQNEMQLLRLENERLQGGSNARNSSNSVEERLYSPQYSPSHSSMTRPASSEVLSLSGTMKRSNSKGNSRSLSCNQSPVTSPLHRSHESAIPNSFTCGFPTLDCCSLHNTLSPESENEGFQVKFVVTSSSTMLPGRRSVIIGSLPVPRRATWDELDRVTQSILMEYCRVVDGDGRLGLTTSSIDCYNVGDLKRDIGGKNPTLLPCAYIVGDVDTVEIKLKDATSGCADQMAFDMLISKDTLECYVTLLLQNRKVLLQGPSGAGKTAFAMSLAEYIVARLRTEGGNTMVAVMDTRQDGEEKLQRYLAEIASRSKTVDSPSVPAVLVVENIHLVSSLRSTFNQIEALCSNQGRSPYVIVTAQPSEAEKASQYQGFKSISCGNNAPHVQRYLTRALRRSLVEHLLTSLHNCGSENGKLFNIVLWIPLCWQHINRFLESMNLHHALIGPKIFLSIPLSVSESCPWFVGVWNHTIIPYIASVMRGRTSSGSPSWEEPTKWVINSFPWDISETGIDPSKDLARLRAQDLQELPSYPPQSSPTDGEDDLPLPPPPMSVRSDFTDSHMPGLRQPCATSSPIKQKHGSMKPQNGYPTIGRNSDSNIWQRQNGSATLNRSSPGSNGRNFNTMGNSSGKFSRRDSGKTPTSDPLKDMLAQLKQAALNPNDDYDAAVMGREKL